MGRLKRKRHRQREHFSLVGSKDYSRGGRGEGSPVNIGNQKAGGLKRKADV